MNELFFLLTFLILSTAFAAASVVAGFVFGYKSDNTNNSIYECGMQLFGDAKLKFVIPEIMERFRPTMPQEIRG